MDVNLCAMLRLAFEQKANYNVNEPDQTILRSKRDDWAMWTDEASGVYKCTRALPRRERAQGRV